MADDATLRLEAKLAELELMLAEAKGVPMSSSIMLNRAEVDGLVGEIRGVVPDEVKQARWVIKHRDDVLAQAHAEAAAVVRAARDEREQLVDDHEVRREAEERVEAMLVEAREQARLVRLEADDYVDAQLAKFEVLLDKTLSTVERGRENLRGRLGADALAEAVADAEE